MSTWVITGANRGLGLEFARQLQAAGERVVATARDPAGAQELVQTGVQVRALDVTDASSVARLVGTLGDEPVDVLVNNAAVGGAGGPIEGLDFDQAARMLAVNSLGPLRVCQALLPNLRRGGRRLIVQVTSKMGSIALADEGGSYAYRASKSALNMFNRCLAQELSREGFTCVLLHPGWVRTDMGGPQAPLTPVESVSSMLRTIVRLSPADNGRFFDITGEPLPW